MTKRDFQIIANATHQVTDPTERQALALRLADEFAARFPRFNRTKFLEACNVH